MLCVETDEVVDGRMPVTLGTDVSNRYRPRCDWIGHRRLSLIEASVCCKKCDLFEVLDCHEKGPVAESRSLARAGLFTAPSRPARL